MIDEKKLIEDIEKEIEFAMKCNMPAMVAGMRQIASIIENQPKIGEWIPADEPPRNNNYILLSFENFSLPMVGRYEDSEDGGAYYLGDCDGEDRCLANDLYVNAWQPLPEPYREGQETKKLTNADRIRNMTDEELAKEIAEGIECTQCPYNDDYETCVAIECEKLFLDWLQSEADQKGQEL